MGVAILSEVVLSAVFVDSPTFSGDAGLFRALITNYLQDFVRCLNTAKYV
jgi:hypothetical protein